MYLSKVSLDISIIYYTCNYLEEEAPVFVENTKKQLLKAAGEHPIISVSHKPMKFGMKNVCVGDIGRGHLNLYKQILVGCRASESKYVAMAEDDIFYSYHHFHTFVPPKDKFAYDMCKLSLFTWTKPPMFTFRTKRMVVNQLIAPRDLLIRYLEERFDRIDYWQKKGKNIDWIKSRWGDPGRYDSLLNVTPVDRVDFYSQVPSIVFTHPKAYGYEFNHGKRKRTGDIKIIEEAHWGRADKVLQYYYKPTKGDLYEQDY